jgi:23S rRNA pseudouridine2457 synthase
MVRSRKVEKEYYVQVDGLIDQEAVTRLSVGVEIVLPRGKYTTLPCTARLLDETPPVALSAPLSRSERHGPTSWISITLTEGKFRQIRKMTAAVGFPTLRLIRIRIGSIYLGDMPAGDVIETNAL